MEDGVGGFFVGAFVVAAIAAILVFEMLKMQPEIKYEELYRFCLAKNIKLEECKIPDKPYKTEINKQLKEKEWWI